MSVIKLTTALCASGSAVICGIALKMLLNMRKRSDSRINEILFYGADNEEHTKQIGVNNLLCIYYVIMHAQSTIDVCVASLNSESFAKCLITVRKQHNVKIRLAFHNSEDFRYVHLFADNGLEVKYITASEQLDHNFVLVDALEDPDVAVAIIGSFDYDTNRVNRNWDNTLLTSDDTVVTSLRREFERVWNLKSEYESEIAIEETSV